MVEYRSELAGKEVDVRVSTIPASNGERVVCGLLDKQEGQRGLVNMGMSQGDLASMQRLLKNPMALFLSLGLPVRVSQRRSMPVWIIE